MTPESPMATLVRLLVFHDELLTGFLTREDLGALSSCSKTATYTNYRRAFFRQSLMVIPEACPEQSDHILTTINKFSQSVRAVMTAPRHLPHLCRLPLLEIVILVNSGRTPRLDRHDARTLTNLPTLTNLELAVDSEDLSALCTHVWGLRRLYIRVYGHPRPLDALHRLQSTLQYVHVEGNVARDIGLPATLTNLTTLIIRSRDLGDLSSISALPQLRHLDVSHCNVADLSPLRALAATLTVLRVAGTLVNDLAPLTALLRLELVDVSDTGVDNLGPLLNLSSSLRHLDMSKCVLTGVDGLIGLDQLECLLLNRSSWPSTTPESQLGAVLQQFPRLRHVSVRIRPFPRHDGEAPVPPRSIADFACLGRLEVLDLFVMECDDIDVPLALPALRHLRLEFPDCELADVPIGAVLHPQLETLELMHLQLRSLENLRRARHLVRLRLVDVEFRASLAPVGALPALAHLDVTCPVVVNDGPNAPNHDLEPLRALTKLQELDLSYTNVQSIGPLGRLPRLRALNLASTNVTDVSGLRHVRTLELLNLHDTEVSCVDGGAYCHRLVELTIPPHVDCGPIRAVARQLRKLLHPRRNCLWRGHRNDGRDDDDDDASDGPGDGHRPIRHPTRCSTCRIG